MRLVLAAPLALLLATLTAGLGGGEPITVYLAGDSTMAEKRPDRRPETGWGELLHAHFDEGAVRIENHARNGRSTRTFLEEGRWQTIVDALEPGDYVFIQFGHNDQSEAKPDRYTPPNQYRANLVRFVGDVRAKEATPVLLTPVVRRRFDEAGRFYDVHGVYPGLVREVATAHDVPLIDLHRASEAAVRRHGAEGSKRLFLLLAPGASPNYPTGLDDHTHFSPRGAELVAALAAAGIREAIPALAAHLRARDAVPRASYDAVVDAAYAGAPGAYVDGSPTYATVGAALGAVPEANGAPFTIFVKPGRYYEKLSVDRPHVRLVGAARDATVITYDDAGGMATADGGTIGTHGSYTLRVAAPDFHLERLTVENGFDFPANAARADDDPAKLGSPQAVAVLTAAGNDRAVFRDCVISGYQDTLFIDAGRHYFEGCRIVGHVDFIFGAGQAVFRRVDVISRDRAGKNPTGYVTAPSTRVSYPYGFLFVGSRLLKETPALAAGSVRLGRPWHPGADPRAEGSAVFIDCYMDDHIGLEGYAPISSRNEAGERVWFDVEPDSRFFEYGSYGPGAHASPGRPVLTAEEAAWYTPDQVLNGWDPDEDE